MIPSPLDLAPTKSPNPSVTDGLSLLSDYDGMALRCRGTESNPLSPAEKASRQSMNETSFHRRHWTSQVALLVAFLGGIACGFGGSAAEAAVIATDGAVPLTMDAGGTSGALAEYLIGSTAGYAYDAAGTVTLGSSSSSYNQLTLENGGRMTIADGFNFDIRGNNSRLVIDGTIVGSARSRLDLNLTEGTFTNRFFIQQNTGSSVEVRNGGVLAGEAFVATSNATNASLTIDGFAGTSTNPSVVFLRSDVIVSSNSSLAVTVSNGGHLEANKLLNLGTLNLSVGNGSRLSLNAGQDFSVVTSFTMDAGATLDLTGTNSNLGSIATGRTVTLSGGGSLSGTTLDGGLLEVATFDAANLTITSGTLQLSGGTLSMGSVGPLSLNANTSLTGYGTVSASVDLNGGSVDGEVDPFLSRNGIEFASNVTGSGTLTDVKISGQLDLGDGGGFVNMVNGTFATGSSLFLDIAGTADGQYDTFSANAASDVSGGDLVIAFSGGYVPIIGDSWTLFSGGFDTADFSSITLPADTELRGYDLVAIPEPRQIGYAVLVLGAVCLRRIRRLWLKA